MKRITLLQRTGAAAATAAFGNFPAVVRAEAKKLLIAEPFHNIQYLPLYVAINQKFFNGLDVESMTLRAGSASTDAVLTGRAWAFIGGPEHNAFADTKGANLRAIVNVVNRASIYFVPRKGLTPGSDLKAFFMGKTIATSPYGGSPNSIARYLIGKMGLDIKKDVNFLELDNSAVPVVMQQGKADIADVAEPILSRGIAAGAWQEPFLNGPKALGAYANSTINLPLTTITDDPATTRSFVEGMLKGLAFVRDRRDATMTIAAKEFPDLPSALLQSAVKRSYDDAIWEYSGMITPASIKTMETIVKIGGLLKTDVPYDQIVDMRFVSRKTGER
ncbi:MAG TPA: ABC transporter substrate-binding protein [Candidatus Acidoferrales bacterium]|nr:ABC transporter substrate-binding protein [Candidatus Acidoferrales bacterium]